MSVAVSGSGHRDSSRAHPSRSSASIRSRVRERRSISLPTVSTSSVNTATPSRVPPSLTLLVNWPALVQQGHRPCGSATRQPRELSRSWPLASRSAGPCGQMRRPTSGRIAGSRERCDMKNAMRRAIVRCVGCSRGDGAGRGAAPAVAQESGNGRAVPVVRDAVASDFLPALRNIRPVPPPSTACAYFHARHCPGASSRKRQAVRSRR